MHRLQFFDPKNAIDAPGSVLLELFQFLAHHRLRFGIGRILRYECDGSGMSERGDTPFLTVLGLSGEPEAGEKCMK